MTGSGGRVDRELAIVNGFAATVPASVVTPLRTLTGVLSVTANAAGHLMSVDPVLGYDPVADEGSLSFVRQALHVPDAWKAGYTGKGVDVALIDSGVARVPGLTSGNVVDGPDLSFESQYADVRYRDTFGHGTHMASIIAGRDAVDTPAGYALSSNFLGIAPDAAVPEHGVHAGNAHVPERLRVPRDKVSRGELTLGARAAPARTDPPGPLAHPWLGRDGGPVGARRNGVWLGAPGRAPPEQ